MASLIVNIFTYTQHIFSCSDFLQNVYISTFFQLINSPGKLQELG